MEETKSVFNTLNEINVNDKVEQKNGLNYLSWAWVLITIKSIYPDAGYIRLYDDNGLPYFQSGTGAEVIGYAYLTNEERDWFISLSKEQQKSLCGWLPIMDYKNKSIPYQDVDSMIVNKTHQRNLAKCFASQKGLGLYIYAGEDLPENEADEKAKYEEAIARIKKVCSDKKLKLADVMKEHKVTRDSNAEYINDVCDKLEGKGDDK